MQNILFKFSLVLLIANFASCKKQEELKQPGFVLLNGIPLNRPNISSLCPNGDLCVIMNLPSGQVIQRADQQGKPVWTSVLLKDKLQAIGVTTAGDVFAAGYTTRNFNFMRTDMTLYKFKSTGEVEWQKDYLTLHDEYAMNLIPTLDGNLLMAGSRTVGQVHGTLLLKVKPGGDTIWSQWTPYSQYFNQYHILDLRSGGFLLTGTNAVPGQKQAWLRRFDANGNPQWDLRNTSLSNGNASVELSDGSIITVGSAILPTQTQAWVQKCDKNGQLLWQKDFGKEDANEECLDIKQNADGSFVITGYVNKTVGKQVMLFRIDGEGNTLQSLSFGRSSGDLGINILKAANDDNLIVGQSNDKMFVVKTDNKGRFK